MKYKAGDYIWYIEPIKIIDIIHKGITYGDYYKVYLLNSGKIIDIPNGYIDNHSRKMTEKEIKICKAKIL